jgi:hypothetical protein
MHPRSFLRHAREAHAFNDAFALRETCGSIVRFAPLQLLLGLGQCVLAGGFLPFLERRLEDWSPPN